MLFLASAIRHDSRHTCFPREIQLNILLIIRVKRTPCVIPRTLDSTEKFTTQPQPRALSPLPPLSLRRETTRDNERQRETMRDNDKGGKEEGA